jgi:multidrug efflux system outer membrane protein
MALRLPRTCALLVPAALLAGCAIGPTYRRPDTQTPPAYRDEAQSGRDSLADLSWWDLFKDPQLRDLVHQAVGQGFDARLAATRVAQARAVAAQVRGQFLPAVGYNGPADRGRNTLLGQPFTEGNGATADGFAGYLSATWELDLWGRVRRLDEAARAQYYASEAGRRAVLLSVVSDTASAYYELLELDEDLVIAKQTAQSFSESLKLFHRQLEGGVVSRLDTASAEAERETALAKIPDLERQIALKENQISLLIGRSPGPVARGATLSDEPAPPVVPAGLPSQLLERRPDVQQAEQTARAANAEIGVTVGGFLPRIGLSALLGAVSPDLSALTHHEAFLWNIGADVSGPVFQGGGLRGQYEQAKAQWEQAKLQYQQTALAAFGDVADALITRQKLAEIRGEQEKAVQAYQDAVRLATERYKAGKASYFEVLQAQELLYPAQLALAQTKRGQFTAVVQLYKALGGGWKMTEAERQAAPPAP